MSIRAFFESYFQFKKFLTIARFVYYINSFLRKKPRLILGVQILQNMTIVILPGLRSDPTQYFFKQSFINSLFRIRVV